MWSLWYGNLYKLLGKIEDIDALIYNFEHTYPKFKPLAKAVEEFRTYIEKNGGFIPTMGSGGATARRLPRAFKLVSKL